MLDRAVVIGTNSRLFDALTLRLLSFMRHDMGDTRRLPVLQAQLRQFLAANPKSRRLQRFNRAAEALRALLDRQIEQAQAMAQSLADETADEDFDLEAANVLLSLWTRLPAREVAAGQQDKMARSVALRFCVSKAITEILVASAGHHETISKTLRLCHGEITAVAEDAMRLAMQDQKQMAVQTLLALGQTTRNARLIEMAGLMLRRHHPHIVDNEALLAQAMGLQKRFCRPITHIAGIRRSGRSPGGLLLRGQRLGPMQAQGLTLLHQALNGHGPAAEASPVPPADAQDRAGLAAQVTAAQAGRRPA